MKTNDVNVTVANVNCCLQVTADVCCI